MSRLTKFENPELSLSSDQSQGANFVANTTRFLSTYSGQHTGVLEITVARQLNPDEAAQLRRAEVCFRNAGADGTDGRHLRALGHRLLGELGSAVTVHSAGAHGDHINVSGRVNDVPLGHQVTLHADAANDFGSEKTGLFRRKASFALGSDQNTVNHNRSREAAAIARSQATTVVNLPKGRQLVELDLNRQFDGEARITRDLRYQSAEEKKRQLEISAGRVAVSQDQIETPQFKKQFFAARMKDTGEHNADAAERSKKVVVTESSNKGKHREYTVKDVHEGKVQPVGSSEGGRGLGAFLGGLFGGDGLGKVTTEIRQPDFDKELQAIAKHGDAGMMDQWGM
jgi:hypothetical protein